MPKKQQKKQSSLFMDDEIWEELDRYAAKMGLSRQKLITNLLLSGLDDLRFLDKSGILAVGMNMRDLIDKVRGIQPTSRQSELFE